MLAKATAAKLPKTGTACLPAAAIGTMAGPVVAGGSVQLPPAELGATTTVVGMGVPQVAGTSVSHGVVTGTSGVSVSQGVLAGGGGGGGATVVSQGVLAGGGGGGATVEVSQGVVAGGGGATVEVSQGVVVAGLPSRLLMM